MKSFVKPKIIQLSLFSLLIGSAVFAQAPADDNNKQDVYFRKTSSLTLKEQLAQSETYITKIKEIYGKIDLLAGRARENKDIIKLNCVNHKLISVKEILNVAETSLEALKLAAAHQNVPAQSHQFSKVTIAFEKALISDTEANTCVGENLAYTGDTQVEIDVDPSITQDDPTEEGGTTLPVNRPEYATTSK